MYVKYKDQSSCKNIFYAKFTLWVTVMGQRSTRVTGGRHWPLRTLKSPVRLMASPLLFLSRLFQLSQSLSRLLGSLYLSTEICSPYNNCLSVKA